MGVPCARQRVLSNLRVFGPRLLRSSILGWHLLEGDDPALLAQHVAEWAEVIELEVNPVIQDGAAAEAASKVFGT